MDVRPKKLLPNKLVCERYSIHPITLERWKRNPALDFPKPVRINGRDYNVEGELDEFDERQRVAASGDIDA